MGKALIIGCGGVASVAIHKCCQNSDEFSEILIASRTKSKCDALKEKLEGTTKTKIRTAQVDADDVEVLSRRAQTAHPPGEAILLHALPVVDRVAPILPVFAESVGRAAGDAARASGSSELEVLRMCPNLC